MLCARARVAHFIRVPDTARIQYHVSYERDTIMNKELAKLKQKFRFKHSIKIHTGSPESKRLYEPYFTYDYPHENWKFGDWILIRHVTPTDSSYIIASRPILGVFVGMSAWDQAMAVNFVESPRAYLQYEECFYDSDPVVESIALWSDNIIPIGHWKSKPTFSELKGSIKNHLKEWQK